jgi:dipeptidyl aminopeptidase/acylaminoacyl peptidase
MKVAYLWPLGAALLTTALAAAEPAPLAAFAARPPVLGVTLSTDGRYLATIGSEHGRAGVFVSERAAVGADARLVLSEPDGFRIQWCRFATETRLLCGLRGMARERGTVYSGTRLVAVDADGRQLKVLVQNAEVAQGQYQDEVLHWNPGPPDTVLVEADEGLDYETRRILSAGGDVIGSVGTEGVPAVWELNIRTGRMKLREHAHYPIRHWIVDPRGRVRLGWGLDHATLSYYARRDGDPEWRRLAKFEAFSREAHFEPIAISAEQPNRAYALAPSEGRDALWLIDLTDQSDPELVFMHPAADVSGPLLGRDGRLLGVRYDTDYPNVYYTDGRVSGLIKGVKKAYPQLFGEIVDATRDESVYVIRSYSDLEPPHFSVVDVASGHLTAISRAADGPPLPEPAALAPMQPVNYPARDGTTIPGYLTVPRGTAAKQLPLVVMPHGGPISRDEWGYFFLTQFLASRGYAVLQMNFRGSSGYGSDWFYAAHQDWGGLTYDDVVDGARWAIAQHIADPQRVAIVGWSFGGYLALVGAQRDAALFRCAASIAGLSDLGLLVSEGRRFQNPELAERQIGTDDQKLRRNSPRLHAAEFAVPVLLVHGDLDAQVQFEQSTGMDAALTRAGKPHRFVALRGADHQLSRAADRVTLLTELEAFLADHLRPAAAAAGGR